MNNRIPSVVAAGLRVVAAGLPAGHAVAVAGPGGVGGNGHPGGNGNEPARVPVLILAVAALLLVVQPAFADRLVRFTVSIDGKVVLKTSTGDAGEDADTVWRYLRRLDLAPVNGYAVGADRDDPLRATLEGKAAIESAEGGRAEVSGLKLVRANAGAPWQVAPAEVERTFKSRNRPLRLTVSIDGKPVLLNAPTSPWAVGGDADAVWRNLGRVELRPFQQTRVEADRDDPLRATLRGKVVIQAGSGGRAEVSELKLVREGGTARWKIDPAEFERTLKTRTKPK
jgi:hypothetical protein